MNPVEPSGKKSSAWFNADNLFTGVIMAFMLVILAVFLLYPVVDICRLSFFKDGGSPFKTTWIISPNPGSSAPFTTACLYPW